MSGNGRVKRFWKTTKVARESGEWRVLLDDKPLRLPDVGLLLLPNQLLAEAVAAEWRDGTETDGTVDIAKMKLTRLSAAAQSCRGMVAADIAFQIGRYVANDLLCYRSDQPELAALQSLRWHPWIEWAEEHYGVTFNVTDTPMPVDQPPELIEKFSQILSEAPPWSLVALAMMTPVFGSLLLGLAVTDGKLGPLAAYELACLEEDWQAERWGKDDVAMTRRAEIAVDLEAAGRFLALCQAN